MKLMVDAAESMWDFRGDLNLEVDGGRFHPSYNSFSDIENYKKVEMNPEIIAPFFLINVAFCYLQV